MSQRKAVHIVGWGSASALGHLPEEIWAAYLDNRARVEAGAMLVGAKAVGAMEAGARATEDVGRTKIEAAELSDAAGLRAREADSVAPPVWTASLPAAAEDQLTSLRQRQAAYRRLDRSVLLAMLTAEQAVAQAAWSDHSATGLYIGSSRGATERWEHYYQQFQTDGLSPQASPLTTAGNLATHTAQHLGLNGWATDHSITCSTALHAIANAVVWLESGRYQHFLAGGTEAPLTPFTLAQMQALKITSKATTGTAYPCRALDLTKTANGMVLGEGSAIFALTTAPTNESLATITGLGYACETGKSLTAVSDQGEALQIAMRQALAEAGCTSVDVIVCHAPGTVLGDQSECNAIRSVFGKNIPSLTSNKWKLGHCLGASGGLSLELAVLMLQQQTFVPVPFLKPNPPARPLRRIMVNAQGFGGNAISLIIEKQ